MFSLPVNGSEKRNETNSVSFFLCLFLPNYLQIIPVNKGTPPEDSVTVQREGGRAEGNTQD